MPPDFIVIQRWRISFFFLDNIYRAVKAVKPNEPRDFERRRDSRRVHAWKTRNVSTYVHEKTTCKTTRRRTGKRVPKQETVYFVFSRSVARSRTVITLCEHENCLFGRYPSARGV